jgi:hypothetical protein
MKRTRAIFASVIDVSITVFVLLITLPIGCEFLQTGEDGPSPFSANPSDAATAVDEAGTAEVQGNTALVQDATATAGAIDSGSKGGSGAWVDGGGTIAPNEISCCAAHESPGCSDRHVQACVCNQYLPDCCTKSWDVVCVEVMKLKGCGVCLGDCCTATNKAGCADNKKVSQCVCSYDKNCCTKWDAFCVQINQIKCGICSL